ncbi:tetratricopeptide repeat protein [Coraliomargarita parva]|uniref:tetratricopeptide repeat protein n=1 Tax=Coraliomargarita parva TaxID=3014050 RepID=UPI0022B3094E|nr:tetratricopeptide repeat protein [Coraliomargarita parva]
MLIPSLSRSRVLAVVAGASLALLSACSNRNAFSDLPLDEQVGAGVEFLRVFNFDSAYKVLSVVQPELPQDDSNWTLATYSLGLAAWHKTPPGDTALEEARTLFELVVAVSPSSELAASALLDLGRMAEISDYLGDPTDVPLAQDYYKRVLDEYPGTEMSTRAALFLAQCMAQSFEPEQILEAIVVLDAALSRQPDSPWASTILQYKAQLYAFYLNDYPASLKPYEEAMELGFPRSSEGDLSLWQLGLLAEEGGDDLLAARAYTRLVRDFPRSTYGAVARRRVVQIAGAHPELDIPIPELSEIELGR